MRAFVLALLIPATLSAYQARTLSPEQAAADVALTRQALEVIHPGFDRYTPKADMDAAFARLKERVRQPISDVELYGEISLLLAKIHCDHTKAELPPALEKFREENPTHLPFRFRLFDGRMYVASSNQLARGTEILSINGVPVQDILSPHRFKGRVTVLTGPANGSGSTMLIAKLKDEGRVRLVGMPTGGSAEGPTGGRIFFLKLPESGITVRIPAKRSLTNVSNFQPGLGVAPDVEVRPTLADFLAGRDPVLGVASGLTTDATRLDRPSNAERHEALKSLLRERGLEFEVQPFTNDGKNVIVTLGSGESDIVIGAHYDAARLQDGSFSHAMVDNAAGSVVLTRVAEALKSRKLRHRVRVIFFDQEEMGLLGSAHYVKSLDRKVAAAVNVDIAGYGDTLIFGPGKNPGNTEVYGAMWRTCAEQRLSCLELPNFPQGDDRSFQAAKIPNISLAILPAVEAHQIWLLLNGGKDSGLAEGFVPQILKTIHTPNDTAEKLDAAAMMKVSEAIVNLVVELDEEL